MAANPLAHARGARASAAQASVASPGRVNTGMKTGSAAREEGPPFRPFRPNAVTIAAMMEARQRRGLPRFTSMQALFDDLHADG